MNSESSEEQARRARTVSGVPTAVALFSGAGGMDLGFRLAGFRLLVASDIDPFAEKTHERNWPDVPFILKDAKQGFISSFPPPASVSTSGGVRRSGLVG